MSEFTVLDQCYCMKDAPIDEYPVNKGICQYCQIKKLLADTINENERLRKLIPAPYAEHCNKQSNHNIIIGDLYTCLANQAQLVNMRWKIH